MIRYYNHENGHWYVIVGQQVRRLEDNGKWIATGKYQIADLAHYPFTGHRVK